MQCCVESEQANPLNINWTIQPVLFCMYPGKHQHKPDLMYNSYLSVITNYWACLLESRDFVCLGVRAFNYWGRWSLFRDVCSLLRPEGVVGFG